MSQATYVKYPQDLKQKAFRKMGSDYTRLMKKTGRFIPSPAIFVNEKKMAKKISKRNRNT